MGQKCMIQRPAKLSTLVDTEGLRSALFTVICFFCTEFYI